MNPEKNTWLSKDGSGQVDFFLSSQDVIIIERNRVIRIIIDIFKYFYSSVSGLKIADFGCGDGIMTRAISSVYPENTFYLIDGSEEMLKKARQNFNGNKYTFQCVSFEKIIESSAELPSMDFVISSLAIHHLNHKQKSLLYKKIFEQLADNSMFLIFDVVKPASKKTEEIQFEMWKWWMNEKLLFIENGKDVGKYDSLPLKYKKAGENQPGSLSENLEGLSCAGFLDVDCYYKYSIYTLFGGIKRK